MLLEEERGGDLFLFCENVWLSSRTNQFRWPIRCFFLSPFHCLGKELEADHPGFHDPVYRSRREEIARMANDHRAGQPVGLVSYTPEGTLEKDTLALRPHTIIHRSSHRAASDKRNDFLCIFFSIRWSSRSNYFFIVAAV